MKKLGEADGRKEKGKMHTKVLQMVACFIRKHLPGTERHPTPDKEQPTGMGDNQL